MAYSSVPLLICEIHSSFINSITFRQIQRYRALTSIVYYTVQMLLNSIICITKNTRP